MKTIREPDLSGEHILTPAEMNKIHFGGNRTPLTPEQMEKLARGETDIVPAKTGEKPQD